MSKIMITGATGNLSSPESLQNFLKKAYRPRYINTDNTDNIVV